MVNSNVQMKTRKGGKDMHIRLNKKEKDMLMNCARQHGTTEEALVHRAILELLEDAQDAIDAEKAYEKYKKNPIRHSQEDIERMLGL